MGKQNNSISTTETLFDRWFTDEWKNYLHVLKREKRLSRKHPKSGEYYDCQYINLKRTRINNAVFSDVDMSNVKAYELFLTNCVFNNVIFYHGDLIRANISNGCKFVNCDFSFSNFSEATIADSSFTNCKFDNSVLKNVQLSHVALSDNSFTTTDFNGINVEEISGTIGRVSRVNIDKASLWNLSAELLKEKIINGNPCFSSKSNGYYDMALSFAGEERTYVEEIANELKRNGVEIFYDDFEKHILLGKDLITHLSEIYSTKSKFVIMFLSQHYVKKAWSTIEYKAALSRLLNNDFESIIPIIMDDVDVSCLIKIKGYLDIRKNSKKEICSLLIKKLIYTELESKNTT